MNGCLVLVSCVLLSQAPGAEPEPFGGSEQPWAGGAPAASLDTRLQEGAASDGQTQPSGEAAAEPQFPSSPASSPATEFGNSDLSRTPDGGRADNATSNEIDPRATGSPGSTPPLTGEDAGGAKSEELPLDRSPSRREHNAWTESDAESARALLRRALSPASTPSDGQWLTLTDAIASRRVEIPAHDVIQAYWTLAAGLTEHYFAQEELSWIESLSGQSADDQALLVAEQAMATGGEVDARLVVAEAQNALRATQSVAMAANTEILLKDRPHTGGYRTHYEKIFANTGTSTTAGRIHATLPLRHEQLKARAGAVAALEKLLEQKTADYQQGGTSLRDLVAVHHNLRDNRRQFVRSVHQYNQQIAQYVSLVTRPGTSASELAHMLVKNAAEPTRVSSREISAGTLPSVLKQRGVVQATPPAGAGTGVVPAGAEGPFDSPTGSSSSATRRDGFVPRREP